MCYRTADCFLFTLIWKNSLQSATLKHILDTPILRSYLFSDYQQWHQMQEKTDTSFIHGSDSPGNVLLRNIEVRFIFTLSRGQGFCPPLIFISSVVEVHLADVEKELHPIHSMLMEDFECQRSSQTLRFKERGQGFCPPQPSLTVDVILGNSKILRLWNSKKKPSPTAAVDFMRNFLQIFNILVLQSLINCPWSRLQFIKLPKRGSRGQGCWEGAPSRDKAPLWF